MKEFWKSIKDYEGIYEVSNLGRVKSIERKYWLKRNKCWAILKENILKNHINVKGYCQVTLSKNSIQKTRIVHQLVAEVFLNHTIDGHVLVIDHKNFIKTDNRVDNLQIITQRENTNKKHIKSTSKYTGVSLHKTTNKWMSCIRINGKNTHLGYFANELDAHNAYQNKLLTLNS
jgi:hypothetical protein